MQIPGVVTPVNPGGNPATNTDAGKIGKPCLTTAETELVTAQQTNTTAAVCSGSSSGGKPNNAPNATPPNPNLKSQTHSQTLHKLTTLADLDSTIQPATFCGQKFFPNKNLLKAVLVICFSCVSVTATTVYFEVFLEEHAEELLPPQSLSHSSMDISFVNPNANYILNQRALTCILTILFLLVVLWFGLAVELLSEVLTVQELSKTNSKNTVVKTSSPMKMLMKKFRCCCPKVENRTGNRQNGKVSALISVAVTLGCCVSIGSPYFWSMSLISNHEDPDFGDDFEDLEVMVDNFENHPEEMEDDLPSPIPEPDTGGCMLLSYAHMADEHYVGQPGALAQFVLSASASTEKQEAAAPAKDPPVEKENSEEKSVLKARLRQGLSLNPRERAAIQSYVTFAVDSIVEAWTDLVRDPNLWMIMSLVQTDYRYYNTEEPWLTHIPGSDKVRAGEDGREVNNDHFAWDHCKLYLQQVFQAALFPSCVAELSGSETKPLKKTSCTINNTTFVCFW